MFNVWFKLIVMQPQLLLSHAKNYADLMTEGLQQALAAWRLRLILYALSAVFFLLGLVSTTVALLLWGALPELNTENGWVLIALPVVLLLLGAVLYQAAQRHRKVSIFDEVQAQLKLDMLALCEAKAK